MADGEDRPALWWDSSASLKLRLFRAQRDAVTLNLDANVKVKTKSGAEFSYMGISQAQVVAKAKAALLKHGVLYSSSIKIDSVRVDGNKTTLIVIGTFESVDTDEVKNVEMWGEGTDYSDNGHAKAFTSGTKQILLKQLNLTTVEDEKTAEVAHEPSSKPAAIRDAQAVTEAAIKTWADAYREALRGCRSLADLKRIRAENASMMQKVPEATRDYFTDMIVSLESALS